MAKYNPFEDKEAIEAFCEADGEHYTDWCADYDLNSDNFDSKFEYASDFDQHYIEFAEEYEADRLEEEAYDSSTDS